MFVSDCNELRFVFSHWTISLKNTASNLTLAYTAFLIITDKALKTRRITYSFLPRQFCQQQEQSTSKQLTWQMRLQYTLMASFITAKLQLILINFRPNMSTFLQLGKVLGRQCGRSLDQGGAPDHKSLQTLFFDYLYVLVLLLVIKP